MSQEVIQAKYEELAVIARKFGQQAQATVDLRSRIVRSVQALERGGWQGQGATAFFAEMNGTIYPAMQRMIRAFEEAHSVTLQISDIMRQAEEEAAAPFRGREATEGSNGSGPTASGGDEGGGFLRGVHEVLDWAGFVPGLGAVPDLINAGIYAIEGDVGNAVLSGAAAVPIIGDAVKGVDKARDIAKAVDKLDDVADAARAADKVDDAADAARAVDKVDDAADAARKVPPSLQDKTFREVEITDARGSPIGEFDKIENGVIIEEKAATGLDKLHPRTGKPVQTPEQWAEKQVYEKTRVRLENLENATTTRPTVNGSPDVPSLDDVRTIRDLEFHIGGNNPALREAVQKQLERLKREFPDWNFDAHFGT